MTYSLKKRTKRMAINAYHSLCIDKLLVKVGHSSFKKKKEKAYSCFLSDDERKNVELLHKLDEDIKYCYMKYLTSPDEFFLFGFKDNTSEAYRSTFLSDNVRIRTLIKVVGEKLFVEELTDKMGFYRLTKPYFKREVFKFTPATSYTDFSDFALRTRHLFVKLLASSYGIGAMAFDIANDEQCREAYDKLRKSGKVWIVEQRIIQKGVFAEWNNSSVNTVRVPSFLHNGKFEIVQPFFRTGRAGSLVDNAGGGGILACVDVKTGRLTTDGCDEVGRFYKAHPNSGIVFKGWQIPEWDCLKALVEEVHRTKMSHHRYIGWDFAYTGDDWVLIEGNWGQFVGQYADHVGVKEIFFNYMNN